MKRLIIQRSHYVSCLQTPLFISIIEILFCEVVQAQHADMALCYRRINGSCAEQVFTGFFIRCFFE